MRVVQITFSPTGGTQKVADVIANEWGSEIFKIDLTDAETDYNTVCLNDGDIAVIAIPSFGGRVPTAAAERLSRIHGNQACCVIVCVYGNRAYEDTLVELEDLAQQSEFRVAAAISSVAEHSIMHQYANGRPDQQDQKELRLFVQKIKGKINDEAADISKFHIPGNRPYKKSGGISMVPKANKDCNECGLCAKTCPVQAISQENFEADSSKCISCMRCVAQCPQSARKLNSAMVSAAALAMKVVCSKRKENELFL